MPHVITDWDGVYNICQDLAQTRDPESASDTIKVTSFNATLARVDLTRSQAKRLAATDLQQKYRSKK